MYGLNSYACAHFECALQRQQEHLQQYFLASRAVRHVNWNAAKSRAFQANHPATPSTQLPPTH